MFFYNIGAPRALSPRLSLLLWLSEGQLDGITFPRESTTLVE